MSFKSLLMPAITAWWLSPARRRRMRASAERRRIRRGQVHTVHYFHQADDPYSALMVQYLPSLLARYDIALDAHVVSPPSDAAAPDRERLIAYSRKDAAWLAQQHGLTFVDPGHQPSAQALDHAMPLVSLQLNKAHLWSGLASTVRLCGQRRPYQPNPQNPQQGQRRWR